MSLLTRAERLKLIDLLLELPNMNNAAARRLLLDDLPQPLQDVVEFDNAPATHIANIVRTVTNPPWEHLPNGDWPALILIENAMYQVRGSRTAQELQSLLDALKARAGAPATPAGAPAAAAASAAPPAGGGGAPGGGAIITGEARNVQIGTGTQYNADQIQGQHDVILGSTVTHNYYYPNPPAPAGGQPVSPAPAGGGGAPTPATAPARNIKLDGPGRRQLHRALLGAYLKLDDLAQMVAFSFGENLGAVAGGDNISSVIFNLMQWAEARGRLGDLIAAAAEDRPQSQDLQAIARQFGLARAGS